MATGKANKGQRPSVSPHFKVMHKNPGFLRTCPTLLLTGWPYPLKSEREGGLWACRPPLRQPTTLTWLGSQAKSIPVAKSWGQRKV